MYIVEKLREYGIDVVEEMVDSYPPKHSMNVDIINMRLVREGKMPLPFSMWVPCLVLELIEDGETVGRIVINVEERVEVDGRYIPCRKPLTDIAKIARDLLENAETSLIGREEAEKHLDEVFGILWRAGVKCLERYEDIVRKILKIANAWVLGSKHLPTR